MADSFGELEASSLFCPRCKRATAVRKKLLLVLPTGNKYDYTCSVCGTQVGGKTDSKPTNVLYVTNLKFASAVLRYAWMLSFNRLAAVRIATLSSLPF